MASNITGCFTIALLELGQLINITLNTIVKGLHVKPARAIVSSPIAPHVVEQSSDHYSFQITGKGRKQDSIGQIDGTLTIKEDESLPADKIGDATSEYVLGEMRQTTFHTDYSAFHEARRQVEGTTIFAGKECSAVSPIDVPRAAWSHSQILNGKFLGLKRTEVPFTWLKETALKRYGNDFSGRISMATSMESAEVVKYGDSQKPYFEIRYVFEAKDPSSPPGKLYEGYLELALPLGQMPAEKLSAFAGYDNGKRHYF